MKKVKLLLTLLAIVFMVSACELSPGEIQPAGNQSFNIDPVHDGEESDPPEPPPPLPK